MKQLFLDSEQVANTLSVKERIIEYLSVAEKSNPIESYKPEEVLDNYRPITILNSVYKLQGVGNQIWACSPACDRLSLPLCLAAGLVTVSSATLRRWSTCSKQVSPAAWSSWTSAKHMIASAAHGSRNECPAWASFRTQATGSCFGTPQLQQPSGGLPVFQSALVYIRAAHCPPCYMCWQPNLLPTTSDASPSKVSLGLSPCHMVSLPLSVTSMPMIPACMCSSPEMHRWSSTPA